MTPRTAFRLARPFTLLPPLLGIVSGAVCAFGSIHNPDPARRVTWAVVSATLLGSLCASFLNAASNVLNQVTDLEVDRVNKPERPLVTGEAGTREAWSLAWALYALAIVPVWFVVVPPREGLAARLLAPLETHQTFFLFLGGLLFTLVYSLPSWGRTKRLGMWANVTIAIPRGALLKVAGWTMVAPAFALEPWVIGLLFCLFLVGAASTKDFSDVPGDLAGGCRTLPIIHGNRKAVAIMSPFFVLPWLLLIPLGFLPDPLVPEHRLLTGNPWLLAALGGVLSGWGLHTVRLLRRNPDELGAENHPSWTHMYLMMMAAQVGFALAYVL